MTDPANTDASIEDRTGSPEQILFRFESSDNLAEILSDDEAWEIHDLTVTGVQ